MGGPSLIMNGVYLGTLYDASNKERLERLSIKSVLNACGSSYTNTPNYMELPLDDSESEEIQRYFDESYHFIEDSVQRGDRILVHCFAGISRSSTLIIHWVARKLNIPLSCAYQFVVRRRPVVRPNDGFIQQLETKFGQKLEFETNEC
jgi:protein-tyrosine phosphatase